MFNTGVNSDWKKKLLFFMSEFATLQHASWIYPEQLGVDA